MSGTTMPVVGMTTYDFGGLDVTNKSAPVLRSTWCSPTTPPATLHYQFLRDKIVHMASYSDGYWAVDVSNPANPRPIAHYDTSQLTGNEYVGAWGCYPFQPSGVVYISDMQSGFWILKPLCGVPYLYGNATPGQGGFSPRIEHLGGPSQVGNATFTLHGRQMRPAAMAALLVGAYPTSVPVLGVDVLVDLLQPSLALSVATSGTSGAAGTGAASLPIPLPNSPSLAGLTFYTQWIVADPSAPGGVLSGSKGMSLTICP